MCIHRWLVTKIKVGRVKVSVLKCVRCGQGKAQTYKAGTERKMDEIVRRVAAAEVKHVMQYGGDSNAE